tara:strand:- start:11100 stop:11285 length:186 start_codon:yes stop_codon:yes gene_type:complete
MSYHPLLGITIFFIAIIISFFLGRLYIKKKSYLLSENKTNINNTIPRGEIKSPDAPWLNKK